MPPTSSDPEATFDAGAALHHAGGDPELLTIVAGMFLEESAGRLARLEDAFGHGDAEALERAAHTLKGTAAILALGRVRELAAGLEEMGAKGDLTDAAESLRRLSDALDEARPVLSALVSSTS